MSNVSWDKGSDLRDRVPRALGFCLGTLSSVHTLLHQPRLEWRGLTAFARRNKACVFRKILDVTLFWNLKNFRNILDLRLSPEISSQMYLHLKIQNTTFLCIKFPPPILSAVHSSRGECERGRGACTRPCSRVHTLVPLSHSLRLARARVRSLVFSCLAEFSLQKMRINVKCRMHNNNQSYEDTQ